MPLRRFYCPHNGKRCNCWKDELTPEERESRQDAIAYNYLCDDSPISRYNHGKKRKKFRKMEPEYGTLYEVQ